MEQDNRLKFIYGKYKGEAVADVARKDPGYIVWFFETVAEAEKFIDADLFHECEHRAYIYRECDATDADIY